MMKATVNQGSQRTDKASRFRGLTLVEMMVTMGIFSLVVIGLVYANLFNLRQDQLVNSKLGASDQSRKAFSQMNADIRSAKLWAIGYGNGSQFTAIPNGTLQRGNALQISLTTDTNNFIRYYFNTNRCELYRMETGVLGHHLIADHLTNQMFFQAEDYLGNVKTDLAYKYVIRIMMEFCQYQFPLTRVGPGYYYDYYKMEFKVTPHCPHC
jgi:prepilin-type N-terminal cleavage/methylation domain-containing protein